MATKRLDRRTAFGVAHLVVAGMFVVFLGATHTFPPVVSFFLFAVPYVWIELHLVEVNDRLRTTSGAMLLLASGVWFGPDSAAFGMACLAILWPFVPADLHERRVFFPVVNLARTVIASGSAGLTLELLLPAEIDDSDSLLITAGAGAAAALVYAAVDLVQTRLIVRLAMQQTARLPWTDVGLVLVSQAAVGAVGGTLGATLRVVGIVLLPVFFMIYLIGQLAHRSYAAVREAQESTIRGFISTLEAKDMFVHGRTARVANLARMIGQDMGFSPKRIERIRWAALLHDVGAVAVPRDLLRNRRSLTDEEQAQLLVRTESVESELCQSDFLRPMMERAARVRVTFSESPQDDVTAEAQVVAVAKWFDSVTSPSVHGQALDRERALSQMRAESPHRYDPGVVDALSRVLEMNGSYDETAEIDSSRAPVGDAAEAAHDR